LTATPPASFGKTSWSFSRRNRWWCLRSGGRFVHSAGDALEVPPPQRWWCFPWDADALGFAEVAEVNGLQLDAEVFVMDTATGEDGKVFRAWALPAVAGNQVPSRQRC